MIARYQAIVAAREQNSERLAEIYRDVDDVVLSIDGLQPEKGHGNRSRAGIGLYKELRI